MQMKKTVLANQRQQWRQNFPITLVYTNYAAENTASSMTKGEIAEFTDFGVRSRCRGINVYLNADVRKHAL